MIRALFVFAAFTLASSANAATIVDNFQTTQLLTLSSGNTSASAGPLALVGLPGMRTLELASPTTGNSATIDINGGNAIVNTASNGGQVTARLVYNYSPAQNFDGAGAFSLAFASYDPGNQNGLGTTPTTINLLINGILAGTTDYNTAGPGSISIPLMAGSLASTNSVTLEFVTRNGTDFTIQGTPGIELIPTVPEPATMASFGLMALVGGYAARRKLKAVKA